MSHYKIVVTDDKDDYNNALPIGPVSQDYPSVGPNIMLNNIFRRLPQPSSTQMVHLNPKKLPSLKRGRIIRQPKLPKTYFNITINPDTYQWRNFASWKSKISSRDGFQTAY